MVEVSRGTHLFKHLCVTLKISVGTFEPPYLMFFKWKLKTVCVRWMCHEPKVESNHVEGKRKEATEMKSPLLT